MVLFWNHEPCSVITCSFADETHGSCQTCQHSTDDSCGLTRAPRPATEGSGCCCHWNIPLVEVPLPVTPAMVAPLAGYYDTARNVLVDVPHQVIDDHWLVPAAYLEQLEAFGIEYEIIDEGLLVNPEQLILVIDEPITDILDRLETPYQLEPETGMVFVEPSRLALPLTFGQGVDG